MVKIPFLSYYVGNMMGVLGMNEIKGKISMKLFCSTCKMKTNHGYLVKHGTSHMDYLESKEDEIDLEFKDDYYITICLGCDTIGFFREYGDESMIDRFGKYYTDKYVYPEEPQSPSLEEYIFAYKKKNFKNVPDIIQELYTQVVSCYELEHHLLAAIGLRMMIEGFCNNKGINDGYLLDKNGKKKLNKENEEIRSKSLEGRINGMEEKRLITPKSAKILHQIRFLGNATAHELVIPKRKTIKTALSIIEDLLKSVYEYENINLE